MKYLVTAALIYANGPMHLGHIRSTYLPADIYARFLRMCGEDVLYVCATDEHGTPIVVNAEKEGITPKEMVDFYHGKDKEIFSRMGFSFDSFSRTSSDLNCRTTQGFFEAMRRNGHIYEKEVKQPYCSKCGRGLPDRLVKGDCPYCGEESQYGDQCEKCGRVLKVELLRNPRCASCGSPPTTKKSMHHFFALSRFSDKLKKWITENGQFQPEVKNYVLNWIDSGLHDWDITRDLDWGIPVPGSEGTVFYVWFDAPIGYVSSTAEMTSEWEPYWKGNSARIVHFIGKDISYHHYLFWPAMLMATGEGYALPYAIPVRGYLNLEGRKFSKSRGWYVSVEEFLEHFPADYLRFYETALTPYSTVDADFHWRDFEAKVNNALVANIGNFIYRTLSLVKRSYDGKIPDSTPDPEMAGKIRDCSSKVGVMMHSFKFKESLDLILALSSEFNAYLSISEPWKREGGEKARILRTALEGVHALSVLLHPFLPSSCDRVRAQLSLLPDPEWGELDRGYGEFGITSLGEVLPLFAKIDPETISGFEKKLHEGQI